MPVRPAPSFCLPPPPPSLQRAARLTAAAALSALCLLPAPRAIAAPLAPSPPISVLFDRDYHALLTAPPSRPAPPQRALPTPPPPAVELRVLTRLLVALVVGGFIGMERRAANSLAGVRTFSLVSLGAALFMSTTFLAFPAADPARVAAAISSSVGFLGAGAMHKNARHHRGLTTASSVWLAAALGIAAASGLFLLSFAGAVSTVLIARYARFDSSLHLIRADNLPPDDDRSPAPPRPAFPDASYLRYADRAPPLRFDRKPSANANGNANGNGNGNGKSKPKPAAHDPVQLQALVDYDPSSQRPPDPDDDIAGLAADPADQ